jgi:phage major head subunit gpT-like protein
MGASGLSSRAIIGMFFNRLAQNVGTEWIDAVSMLFQSDQESETYKWLGMSPQMREWVGGRNAKGFRENGITIINKDYEATMEVLLKELRRDKTGQIRIRINELADRTNAHWAKLLSAKMILGSSEACYDTSYFFADAHSEGDSGSQDNNLSIDISALPTGDTTGSHGSTTSPSIGEMSLCILQAIAAITGFKDDQGEPMNEGAKNFIVMVPSTLYPAALGACTVQYLPQGMNNPLMASNAFNVIPVSNVRLNASWSASFAVFRTDGNTKPFIRQEELPVTIAAVAEGSELEFNENKHHYGVMASRNVGFGYWQHGCLVTMT